MAEAGEGQPLANPAVDPLVAHLRRCCLRVMGEKPGCGFVVAPKLLITCAHVVGPKTPVGATLELRDWGSGGGAAGADHGEGARLPLQAEVLANEATVDLALLRLLSGDYPYVALDGEARLGDQLVAIGFPQEGQRLELDQFTAEFEGEVSFSDDSGLGPTWVELKFKGGQVRHGFSGGPLLNRRTWRVIGLVVVTRDARSPMGGFAKPLSCIDAVLEAAGLTRPALDSRWSDSEEQQRQLAEGIVQASSPEQLLQQRKEYRVSSPFILPNQDYPLYGRSKELDRLKQILLGPENQNRRRIAAITGMTGIGKSALASRFAMMHREAYSDGIITVDAKDRDFYHIAREIERVVNHHSPSPITTAYYGLEDSRLPKEIIESAVGSRNFLIIFDNVNKTRIDDILPCGTECAVIITTQCRKGGPLANLPENCCVRLDVLSHDGCIELLCNMLTVQRINEQHEEVAKLIRILDHHPFALKIAAERLRGNDLQIAEYIDLLIRTQKKIRKGHQSKYQSNELQLAFMECWESLDPITQEFLACISLCARTGFSSRTAAEITEITDRDEVNDLLDFLESRSLINWCGGIGKRHERAKLHALFRNFCNDQANRLNLVSSTLEKHSNWFSQWLESIGITSEEAADQMLIDPAIVDQIAEDLDDIIIASEWVYKQPSFSDHYQFSSIPAQTERLFPVLAHFCHWDKALRLVEKLRKWSQNSCDHERVARFGMHEARFLSKLGKQENAIEILEEICIPSAKLISDPGERAARESKIYNVAGGIHEIRKDRSNAINAFLINAQIDEGIGDYRSLAIVANRLGTNYRLLDSSFEALSWFNKQLSVAEYLLDVRMQRSAWNGISLIHKSLGDYDQELYSLNQEIELSSQCGDQRALALALSRLGHLHLRRKQHKEAVEWYKQAISISSETIGQASFYIQLGKARMELKENSKALLCFKKAIWISSKHNDIENKIRGICQLGILFYENREFVKAYTFFNMSLDLDLLSTEHIRHRRTIQSLAFYLSKDGFHFEAKAICDKLVKLLSGSPEYLDTLAKTYKVMGFSYSFRNLHLLAYNSFQKSYLLYFELDGKPAKLIKPMYSLLRSIKAAGSPHEKVIETSLKIDSLSVRMLWVLYVLGSDIIYKSSVGEFTLIDFLIESAKDAKIFLWQEIGQSIKQMRSAEHGCNSVALMIEHSCSRISGQVQTIREREICSECIHSLAISRRNTADSLRLRSESTYKNLLYAEAEYFSHITLLLTTRNCEARIKGLNTLASIARRREDTQLSQQCLREAFDLSASYPSLQMQVASHLGYVIAMQGNTDPDCYLRYIEHGIMLAENLADKRHLCIAHGQFAEVIQARLLDADAMAHLIISWENACLVDPLRRTTLEWAATNLVSFLLSQGKLVDAERFCSHSLNILPNDLTLSQLLDKIIEYRESGKRPTALIRTGESISVSTGTNNPLQDRLFIEEDDYDGELFEYDDIFRDY